MSEENTPHVVDVHVGRRVRLARKAKGMSQESLAAKTGVTFQQCQKYENGTNRVSASRLWEIARALGLPISYFYDGLPDAPSEEAPLDRMLREFAQTSYGRALMIAAMELPVDVVTQATALLLTMARPADNVKPMRRVAR